MTGVQTCALPISVVLDEAIEMAKDFSGPESGKFVNGILDRLPADPSQVELPAALPPAPEPPEEIRMGRASRTYEVRTERSARPHPAETRGGRPGPRGAGRRKGSA